MMWQQISLDIDEKEVGGGERRREGKVREGGEREKGWGRRRGGVGEKRGL